MSNYANLKSAIQEVIKTNGRNEITGQLLQNELLAMINTLGYGYQFRGIANPDTVPGTPDAKVFYIAYTPGTYTNFNGIDVTGLCVLKYANSWVKEDIPVSGGGGGTEFTVEPTDLTLASGTPNKLKFADRLRESNITTGKNYIILRESGTLAGQMSVQNAIYEIRYDFDLDGGTLTIPSGSTLFFNGGSIVNGEIVGNNTKINSPIYEIFNNVTFSGTFDVPTTKTPWFNTLLSAMDFCALTSGKDLDGCGKLIEITGTTTFRARHNFNIKNLNISFTPTANGQNMFLFDSETSYVGGNKKMRDCSFACVETQFTNICCLNFQNWYNTARGIYENILIRGFNGYAIVNQSYLQESIFDSVKSVNVGGFITYNPDLLFGEKAGSSNLVLFRNCGIDDGIQGNQPYIVDLNNAMVVDFHNFVAQGNNANSLSTRAMRVQEPNALQCRVTFNTFWVEFNNQSNATIIDIGNRVDVVLRGRCPLKFNISGYANLDVDTNGFYELDTFLDNLNVTYPDRVKINFSANSINPEITPSTFEKIRNWREYGVMAGIKVVTNVARDPRIRFENKLAYYENGIEHFVSKTLNRQTNDGTFKMVYENGVNLLRMSVGDTQKSISLSYPVFSKKTRVLYVDMIFRISTNIDVTEENKSTIKCVSKLFSTGFVKQGLDISPYTPVAGQTAGYTDGWKRVSYVGHLTDAVSALNTYLLVMRNTTIDFAKLDFRSDISFDDENIYIDGNAAIAIRNPQNLRFFLGGIDAYNRNVALSQYVVSFGKESHAIFDVDGNTYCGSGNGFDYICGKYPKSGTTSQRPSFSSAFEKEFFIGFVYFDTTIGGPVVWNGTAYVVLTLTV